MGITQDISAISSQIDVLDAKFANYQGGDIDAVNVEVTNLVAAFNKATNTVKNSGQLSEADTQTVLSSVQALEPKISNGVGKLVTRKSDLDNSAQASAISAAAKKGVADVQSGYKNLISAISANAHSSIKSSIDAALNNNAAAALSKASSSYK